jgi:RNA recognition motif-containing protein
MADAALVRETAGGYERVSRPHERPKRSVDGWVLFVRGLHSDSTEEDVVDAFAPMGELTSVTVNLDKRSSKCKVRPQRHGA